MTNTWSRNCRDHFETTWYGMDPLEDWTTIRRTELRGLLTDAWLSGLAYSLNLVEGEKEKRNFTDVVYLGCWRVLRGRAPVITPLAKYLRGTRQPRTNVASSATNMFLYSYGPPEISEELARYYNRVFVCGTG